MNYTVIKSSPAEIRAALERRFGVKRTEQNIAPLKRCACGFDLSSPAFNQWKIDLCPNCLYITIHT
jgi:hypothetical protein